MDAAALQQQMSQVQQEVLTLKAEVASTAGGEERLLLQRRLAALQEKEVLLLKQSAAAAAAGSTSPAIPTLYKNLTLHVAGDARTPEFVRRYARVSRATLQKVLDGLGCDVVLDPRTQQLVGFDGVELHDGMLLSALRYSVPWEARVSTLEGFVESSVQSFEADATQPMLRRLQQRHSDARVLPVRSIESADGKRREVDGAVVADGCAAILEAKQVLDDAAVSQLSSCLEFIRDSELKGPAAELKGKKLLGFLAGRTLSSDPGRVQKLVGECRQHGYGILVSSGRALSLGNSRVPRLDVQCCARGCRLGAARVPSCSLRMF